MRRRALARPGHRECRLIVNLVGESLASVLLDRPARSAASPQPPAPRPATSPTPCATATAPGPADQRLGHRLLRRRRRSALGENAEPGGDFLAMLCYEWERNAHARRAGARRRGVHALRRRARRAGGALPVMLPASGVASADRWAVAGSTSLDPHPRRGAGHPLRDRHPRRARAGERDHAQSAPAARLRPATGRGRGQAGPAEGAGVGVASAAGATSRSCCCRASGRCPTA